MWNCCCEYKDQTPEDDCCPDWCESRRVKGRFGLAFVAETPCCCPEPIGWQVEFCDTPSKVEQRCKEMVQWANCPPLPRCEPCPPVEVCSPCFPPRCNPCCPLTNPCPPRCPPRCCPCPRPASPKRKFRTKECCCQVSKLKKCCCSVTQKPKNKYCRCEDEDEEEDEPCCPCKKSSKGKKKRDRSKRRDDERGDQETDKESSQKDASFFGDEVPVKESKIASNESRPSYVTSTPLPYRTSNQRATTPPRATGRNSTVQSTTQSNNTVYLSTSLQVDNSRPDSTPYMKSRKEELALLPPFISKDQPEIVVSCTDYVSPMDDKQSQRKFLLEDESKTLPLVEKKELNFGDEIDEHQQEDIGQYNAYLSKEELTMGYVYNQPTLNYTNELKQHDDILDLYNQDRKYTSQSSLDHHMSLAHHDSSMGKRRKKSMNDMPKRKTSFNLNNLNETLETSTLKTSKVSHMGRFTTVYSNIETELSDDSVLVKRRRWLPYELIKSMKKKLTNLFKNSHIDEDDDGRSNISTNTRDSIRKNLVSSGRYLKNY